MIVNLDHVEESFLARWARARIAADAETLAAEIDRNPTIADSVNCAVGLSIEAAAVLFRDVDSNAVFTLAPGDVIGQTVDGRHVALRDGVEVIPSTRREAAPLN